MNNNCFKVCDETWLEAKSLRSVWTCGDGIGPVHGSQTLFKVFVSHCVSIGPFKTNPRASFIWFKVLLSMSGPYGYSCPQ